jgi:hypothetical protein
MEVVISRNKSIFFIIYLLSNTVFVDSKLFESWRLLLRSVRESFPD